MEMEEAKTEDIFAAPRQNHPRPRSEARIRYYKPPNARRRQPPQQEKKPTTGFREHLVFQAIICGGFLAVLLFLNIVDSSPTNAVTGWISRNISHDMLAEEGGVGGWLNSVFGIFDNDQADYPAEHYETYGHQMATENTTERVVSVNHTEADGPYDSRVDENILREIESLVDVYYENNR
ncbi:MAG: hypothetical protein FWC93_04975 [Defluviitaleaceae bacterium]|nr:hypothetical protein [Defluviitaleaceae bacterium]